MRKTIVLVALYLGMLPSTRAVAQGTSVFPPIPGWKIIPDTTVYTSVNLYDLIDGAADLFLSYGFVDLHRAEYVTGDSLSVRVEAYRHSSATNAFGIYSQERNTDYSFVAIGTEGYIEDGILNFLAGVYYVKLSTGLRGEAGRQLMTSVASTLEGSLASDRDWPAPLSFFPTEGKIPHSELYVSQNFLGYTFFANAFSAAYSGKEPFTLFVICAVNQTDAGEMLRAYTKAISAPPPPPGELLLEFVDPHTGKLGLKRHGRYLLGISRHTEAKTARDKVGEMEGRVGVGE